MGRAPLQHPQLEELSPLPGQRCLGKGKGREAWGREDVSRQPTPGTHLRSFRASRDLALDCRKGKACIPDEAPGQHGDRVIDL